MRDVDVLAEASRRADVSVTFSVPTVDDEVWRKTEPGTAPPRQRLRALKPLVDAGVRASVGMAPLLPGISDHPSSIARVVTAAREAGACGIWANLLYLSRARASTSSSAWRATGPSCCPSTSGSTRAAPTSPPPRLEPARDEVRTARACARDPRPQARTAAPAGARDEQLSLLSA